DRHRNVAFERRLYQLHMLFHDHRLVEARHRLGQEMWRVHLFSEGEITLRQAARFWYLGGRIAFKTNEMGLALQCFKAAGDFIVAGDWASHFEVTQWYARVNLNLNHYRIAQVLYTELLMALQQHHHLVFVVGDRESFPYFLRLRRAQALFGSLQFAESQREVEASLRPLKRWLIAQTPQAQWRQRQTADSLKPQVFTMRDLFPFPHSTNRTARIRYMVD